MRKPQSVGINLAARCNATCAHCCVESSPRATDSLTFEQVDLLLDDLLSHHDVREIGFTGGEPMLNRARFLQLARRVTESGRSVTCVTNGFWAVTSARADEMFAQLEDVGLSCLTISYDEFHAPYVSVRRIKNALEAAARSSLTTILNMAVSKSHDSIDLLREIGDSALGVQVTRFPVQQCGTGRTIPTEDLHLRPLDQIPMHCPGFEVIYHHDQMVYPCCSPPIFDTEMTLGTVGETDHEGFVRRLEQNALLAVVQRQGLGWFVDKMAAADPDSPAAHLTEAVSACDVCAKVVSDHSTLELIRDDIMAAATAPLPA